MSQGTTPSIADPVQRVTNCINQNIVIENRTNPKTNPRENPCQKFAPRKHKNSGANATSDNKNRLNGGNASASKTPLSAAIPTDFSLVGCRSCKSVIQWLGVEVRNVVVPNNNSPPVVADDKFGYRAVENPKRVCR